MLKYKYGRRKNKELNDGTITGRTANKLFLVAVFWITAWLIADIRYTKWASENIIESGSIAGLDVIFFWALSLGFSIPTFYSALKAIIKYKNIKDKSQISTKRKRLNVYNIIEMILVLPPTLLLLIEIFYGLILNFKM